MTRPIALFSKPGDVRSEVYALIDAERSAFGGPIQTGVAYVLYLDQPRVTVVLINELGRYLVRRLKEAGGWRDESAANGINEPSA